MDNISKIKEINSVEFFRLEAALEKWNKENPSPQYDKATEIISALKAKNC
jgi:hypothetical protein